MTRDEILSAPAGTALNQSVERHVFGENRVWLAHYSTNAYAAWRVVAALSARGCRLTLEDRGDGLGWSALFDLPDGHDTGHATGDTPALAIARATLLVPERFLR